MYQPASLFLIDVVNITLFQRVLHPPLHVVVNLPLAPIRLSLTCISLQDSSSYSPTHHPDKYARSLEAWETF